MRQAFASKPGRPMALRLFIFLPLLASCGRTSEPSIALVDPSAIEIRGLPPGVHPSVHVNVGEELIADLPVAGGVQVVNGVVRNF